LQIFSYSYFQNLAIYAKLVHEITKLPCSGNYLPHSVLGSDVISRQFGLYPRWNSTLGCAVGFLDYPDGIRRLACLTPRREYPGPGVSVAVNEASLVLAYEHAEIVVETGSAVHQVIFPL
jgi:hypothetical protein